MIKIIFLYTRLPDYFEQCVAYLVDKYPVEAIIVRYEADRNAQFIFEPKPKINLVFKSSFDSTEKLHAYINSLNPSIIYCSGWNDKDYMSVISEWHTKVPTLMGLDNPWENTLRQKVGVILFRLLNKLKFSHIWVAGYNQYEFAKKLGYKNEKIIFDLYCANIPNFYKAYSQRLEKINMEGIYPKQLLFIGRFVKYKQPEMLIRAFKELLDEGKTFGWTLLMIGEGPLKNDLKIYENDKIKIKEFLHPNKLIDEMAFSGAFCLPSKSEHWGVVIHEASAAGLPIITTYTTYSATRFVISKFNGFVFKDSSISLLKNNLSTLFKMNNDELLRMSNNSYNLSGEINHEKWAASMMSILESN